MGLAPGAPDSRTVRGIGHHEVVSDTLVTEKAPANHRVEHPDPATRAARGREARKRQHRTDIGEWQPASDRPDPVALLRSQEETRVADLLAIRHERMLASPFAFYRGAAIIMAADLGAWANTGLIVQACGDAHLANFGGFASPERQLVFDMNDFDETSRGPFEWDVLRLAASFEIAGRAGGFDPEESRFCVTEATREYRGAMAQFATMTNLDVWYSRLDLAAWLESLSTLSPDGAKRVQKKAAKAEKRTNLQALRKLTQRVDGEVRFKSDPPLLVPITELHLGLDHDEGIEFLRERLRTYRHSLPHDRRHLLERYRLVDMARKVVGVGSVGSRCWVALMLGRDDDDPLLLQIKEAVPSVLEEHAGKSPYANHGQRVVEGQRLLQTSSDIMLGWAQSEGIDGVTSDYYVRQLWDWKTSADVESMPPLELAGYARMCAWTLARAHAVSGDPIAIASYLGTSDKFDQAVADFAATYADQNQRDFEAVAEAKLV
jgi:uncharacterized protein (DUF2252 family)